MGFVCLFLFIEKSPGDTIDIIEIALCPWHSLWYHCPSSPSLTGSLCECGCRVFLGCSVIVVVKGLVNLLVGFDVRLSGIRSPRKLKTAVAR